MKEKFIPVWYSSFGTDEEQEEYYDGEEEIAESNPFLDLAEGYPAG